VESFEAFIQAGWAEHANRPREVAERLARSLGLVVEAAHVEPFARLTAHVYGEHLGEWQRGIGLLDALRRAPACDAQATAAVARHAAALRWASGDETALTSLTREDAACTLAAAAAACAGRQDLSRAVRSYTQALALAAAGLPDGAPALRALAVGGNNLAAALEEKPARSADENVGMVAAARGGLTYWKRAGGWLEEERAEFRLARSLTLAGEPRAAAEHARHCLAVCEVNSASAFERFFGWFALAAAQRAAGESYEAARQRALATLAEVAPDEQRWCEAERRELGG